MKVAAVAAFVGWAAGQRQRGPAPDDPLPSGAAVSRSLTFNTLALMSLVSANGKHHVATVYP